MLMPKANPALKAVPAFPPDKNWWVPADYTAHTDDADVADILAATQSQAIANQVKNWRQDLRNNKAAQFANGQLPAEFALYEKGAFLYHKADLPGAREQWQKILDLPEKDRTHRTLWATYMIGRSLVDSDPEKASVILAKVPQLAKPTGPYADSLGLASASLGWQARSLWKQNKTAAAVDLFLQQVAAGEPLATPGCT